MTQNTNDYFNILFNRIYFTIILLIFIYSLLKERQEFGCSGWFKIKKHCNDMNSIYFKGTEPSNTDSKEILSKKLKSILRIHNKHAIWRKCFIISTVIIFFVKGLNQDIKPQSLIGVHLITLSIIYFYHNFMNFHVNRIADKVGSQIIDMITAKQITKKHDKKLTQMPNKINEQNKKQIGKLFSKYY